MKPWTLEPLTQQRGADQAIVPSSLKRKDELSTTVDLQIIDSFRITSDKINAE